MTNVKGERLPCKGSLFLKDILFLIVVNIVATILSAIVVRLSGNSNNVTAIFILAVTLISYKVSWYMWGVIASIIGVIGVNYFFTYPFFSLNFTLTGYPIMFFSMLLISLIISTITSNLKKQMDIATNQEQKTQQLYVISQKLLVSQDKDSIIELIVKSLNHFLNCPIVFYKDSPSKNMNPYFIGDITKDVLLSHNELEVVKRVFVEKVEVNLGSSVIVQTSTKYIPVISHEKVLGVVGILTKEISEETLSFIKLMISQIAMALERQNVINEKQRITIESEKEKMRSNLLRAISHDLRTPLTGIIGASAAIKENGEKIDKVSHDNLIDDINEDAEWLLHMVENLLSVTRINENDTTLTKVPEAVEEVVSVAVQRIRKRFPLAKIRVNVPDEFIMVPMDATLICQVLINLIENAIKHGESKEYIDIKIFTENNNAVFEVRDYGKGLSSYELKTLFEEFAVRNHKNSDTTRGLGLGLSICRSVVKAHGGEIKGINMETGGALFTFTIPMGDDEDVS